MRKKLTAIAVLTAVLLLAGCAAGNEEISTVEVGKIVEETPSKITLDGLSETASQGGEVSSESISGGGESSLENANSGTDNSTVLIGDSGSEHDTGAEINADITVPKAETLGIYYAWSNGVSEDKAYEIKQLLLDGDGTDFTVVTDNRDRTHYYRDLVDRRLSVFGSGHDYHVSFETKLGEYINRIFTPTGSTANTEFFKQEKLAFCPPDEAVSTVSAILDKLGIEVCSEPKVYALDETSLKNAKSDLEAKHPSFYDDMTVDVSAEWESYYITFNQEYEGVPLHDDLINYQSVQTFMPNPEISAIVSADGLQHLVVSNALTETQLKENVPAVISAEDAAKIIVEEYSYSPDHKVIINEIELMYSFDLLGKGEKAPKSRACILRPVWVCRGSDTEYFSKEMREMRKLPEFDTKLITIVLDAVTGKELV